MTTATTPRTAPVFHVEDRCDRCSAAARVLVMLRTGGELVFCGHHANEQRAALQSIALLIEHDDTSR